MNMIFADLQDQSNPMNGSVIGDGERVYRFLDSLRTRKPFVAEFLGDNGYHLKCGIGGTVGCVQHSRADGDLPYLMAVVSKRIVDTEHVEFLMGDTPTPIAARYILPFSLVMEIIAHFGETGERSAKVAWEAV